MNGPFPGRLFRWSAVLAYSALIFFLSSQSSVDWGPEGVEGFDKVEHFLAYAAWAWLFSWALGRSAPALGRLPVAALSSLAGTLYGASDELHQAHVPGREADLLDLLFDAAGSAAGAALHAAWGAWRARRSPPP